MCPGWGSNPYPFRDTILSRARIPVPPPGQFLNILGRRRAESHRRIKILQIFALLLGYYALLFNYVQFNLNNQTYIKICSDLWHYINSLRSCYLATTPFSTDSKDYLSSVGFFLQHQSRNLVGESSRVLSYLSQTL